MEEPPDYPRPPNSRSCSRARAGNSNSQQSRRRSGSSTPVLGTSKLPSSSRPSSPSRLRSLPSVGLSNVEAVSDGVSSSSSTMHHDHVHEMGAVNATSAMQEDSGREKEAQLPPPRPISTFKFAEEPLSESGISDYTFIPKDKGGLLGNGKFSSVQLAWKHGVKYAIKITPLYPHHNLIATRLLREPTILAQLPLHPNLVKVYESIRTPGHFYLVEEYLEGYINLETFVSSQPESKLTPSQTLHIFHQLVSVVRSALHEPIQIAHRDIKPENILINPITLRIILLDFGLSTHFSSREAKLTTCCGSPAFHSPELVKSLRSPPGSVTYWGPEIDIWTIGVTILRCLNGIKYPLGVKHTSLQHLNDKCIDAILAIQHKEFRHILAGLLDMDGEKRMSFFRDLPTEIDQIPYKTLDPDDKHDYLTLSSTTTTNAFSLSTTGGNQHHQANGYNRQFKNTSFIETEPKHSLSLLVASPPSSATQSGFQDFPHHQQSHTGRLSSFLRSRSQSRDRLSFAATTITNGIPGLELSALDERLSALNPSLKASTGSDGSVPPSPTLPTIPISTSPELILLNPQAEPAMRAISYVKYALRCAGIIYHIQAPSDDLSQDMPSVEAPKENLCYPILHCVRLISPKEAESNKSPAASLLNQLRPPLTRAATMGAAAASSNRSSSTPPNRHNNNASAKTGKGKTNEDIVRCAEFWIQIIPVFALDKETTTAQSGPSHTASQQADSTNATTVKPKERSSSQKRRPKSKSRGLSAMNIHQNHHYEDMRRCTKLRLRISDESVVEVLRKALSTSSASGGTPSDYAMYATPPPPRHAALRNDRDDRSDRKMSGEDEADTSREGDRDRGRPLLSRSRSDEKSRSRSKTRRPLSQAGISGKGRPSTNSPHHDHMKAPPGKTSSTTEENATATTNGPSPTKSKKGDNDDDDDDQVLNGVLEVRLDSEEEARQGTMQSHANNAKRGFFDFVSAFNMRSKPPPTMVATAPSTPAAIPEEVDLDGDDADDDKVQVRTTTKPVPSFAFAAM